MAKKKEVRKSNSSSNKSNEKACAILSYFFVGIIWYFADEKMKKSDFAKFHAKQGLVLLIADLIAWAISMVPLIGWIISPILYIGILVLLIVGIVNSANGNMKELPLIGGFAKNFNF
jgi:uncharacterized membrane protein